MPCHATFPVPELPPPPLRQSTLPQKTPEVEVVDEVAVKRGEIAAEAVKKEINLAVVEAKTKTEVRKAHILTLLQEAKTKRKIAAVTQVEDVIKKKKNHQKIVTDHLRLAETTSIRIKTKTKIETEARREIPAINRRAPLKVRSKTCRLPR